jgi:LuxR family transcriptional regulator, maltose regulon positive regulatory protein
LRQHMEAKGWQDERLKVMVLQAVALHAHGEKDEAVQVLSEGLTLAEPGGFIRVFVDEGLPMKYLLQEMVSRGMAVDYARRLLAAFSPVEVKPVNQSALAALVEPLSTRELEVLQYLAAGLTNQEIANRLYLSLNTVKVHTRNIYGKLGVNHRTQAVARAQELGVLPRS